MLRFILDRLFHTFLVLLAISFIMYKAGDPVQLLLPPDATQAQILYLMQTLVSSNRTSLIFISHDLSVISQISHTIAVMYAGRIVEYGDRAAILNDPKHPYTQGLIGSLPSLAESGKPLKPIPGTMPSLTNLPQGCYFKTRCPLADSLCDTYPKERIAAGRRVACHKV